MSRTLLSQTPNCRASLRESSMLGTKQLLAERRGRRAKMCLTMLGVSLHLPFRCLEPEFGVGRPGLDMLMLVVARCGVCIITINFTTFQTVVCVPFSRRIKGGLVVFYLWY